MDTHIHYTREGPPLREARHVVCMWHGAPGSTFDWRYVAPCLSSDIAIIRLELPGHGESPRGAVLDADPSSPTMERAVLASIRGIAEAEGMPLTSSGAPPRQPPLELFALAHSIGSLEALGLCDPFAAESAGSTAIPVRFLGCALVSPFGLRPHQAIKVLAKRPDGSTFWLLRHLVRSQLAEMLLRPLVRFLSARVFGFGSRASASELFWMLKRAAASDYTRVNAIYRAMRDAKTPLHLFYGSDDPLMERAVHDEVATLLGISVREVAVKAAGGKAVEQAGRQTQHPSDADAMQRATVFVGASHYSIRSHPQQLAEDLEAWMDAVRSARAGGASAVTSSSQVLFN